MAIAIDATSSGRVTDTSLTFAHTCTGSDLILFVGAFGAVGSDNITGATYNGVAMTLVGKVVVASGRYTYLFRLIAPATGAHNVVISANASSLLQGLAASYTGVDQTTFIDQTGTNTSTGAGSHTQTLTTIYNNEWMIAMVVDNNGNGQTAGADTTQRVLGSSSEAGLYDTNAVISPAGSRTLTVNLTSGTGNWTSVGASFIPVGGAVLTANSNLTLLNVG